MSRELMDTMYDGIVEILRTSGYDVGIESEGIYIEKLLTDSKPTLYRFKSNTDITALTNLLERTVANLDILPLEEVVERTHLQQAAEEILLFSVADLDHCMVLYAEDGDVCLRILEEHSVPEDIWIESIRDLKEAVDRLEIEMKNTNGAEHVVGEPTRLFNQFLSLAS